MDHKALTILKHLSDGNDPETGKPFPPDSPYQRPDVIRALFHAVRELENPPAGVARRCDPGAGSLPEDTAGALLASAVASPRRGAPAPRSGKPAEGGAVPASEARRCDPERAPCRRIPRAPRLPPRSHPHDAGAQKAEQCPRAKLEGATPERAPCRRMPRAPRLPPRSHPHDAGPLLHAPASPGPPKKTRNS